MRPELIVAEKEFRDHITSKRFIVIFGIMLLLGIYAINSGMDAYNQQLDNYKDQKDTANTDTQRIIQNYGQMIQEARERGDSPQSIQSLQDNLDRYQNPPMPSILPVFQSMLMLFIYLGMVLGASLGFDQIAREKDEGSLKFLVTSPIYRDAIVNGKTIGAIAALAGAMIAAFAITIAIMLLKGVVPGGEDMIRIFLFFLASLLYCTVFFAIAMMVSSLSKNTAVAAIMTVGAIFLVFIYTILAGGFSYMIAQNIVGPAPEADYNSYVPPAVYNSTIENGTVDYPVYTYTSFEDTEYGKWQNRLSATQAQITDLLGTFSPLYDYGMYNGNTHMGVGYAMITKEDAPRGQSYVNGVRVDPVRPMSLLDSLVASWLKVLSMIIEIVAAFGIAYIVFMRADVR
jgi:ABC-2 type transport system permease protein